jgi:hypothetical protein
MTRFNWTWIVVLMAVVCSVSGTLEKAATGQEKTAPSAIPSSAATIKDATLTDIDEAGGTISLSFGKKDKPTKLENVPLADGVRLVASHIIPTFKNHLPFEWVNLKQMKGKVVSIRVRTSASGISVESISENND